ncbi:hypothetical protein [Bacillus mesophilum]|uniref:Uncharacterized protein n=1 Tax=Bacillus mesophilum TaxID=1071718 RepID=A0A7V7RM03_9BACI|nr:hypothetical protein [Bacillus mesophilum]KAB2332924.1 hypothetical protein F7732_12650 [Bacillus mesophilum]
MRKVKVVFQSEGWAPEDFEYSEQGIAFDNGYTLAVDANGMVAVYKTVELSNDTAVVVNADDSLTQNPEFLINLILNGGNAQ